MSKFFPAKTMGSHVTNWNKNTSVKFRTDVSIGENEIFMVFAVHLFDGSQGVEMAQGS